MLLKKDVLKTIYDKNKITMEFSKNNKWESRRLEMDIDRFFFKIKDDYFISSMRHGKQKEYSISQGENRYVYNNSDYYFKSHRNGIKTDRRRLSYYLNSYAHGRGYRWFHDQPSSTRYFIGIPFH